VTEDLTALVRQEWASYVEPLLPIAERLSTFIARPGDPRLRREYYRSVFAEIATGYLGLLYADPRYPDFWPFTTLAFNAYLNNPDDVYWATPLEDTGVYRIAGFRGTVRMVDFQVGKGTFLPRGVADQYNLGITLANYDLDRDAQVADDGSFEVILSPERPAGYQGDWWELRPEASNIFNRQVSYDWMTEIDARYGIERLDLPAPRPRPTAEQLEENLRQVALWVEGSMRATCGFVVAIKANRGINRLEEWDLNKEGYSALQTQKYVYGGFELEPDEALVLEFEVPNRVRYWSIHLADDFGFILDWMHRQTIINGHTAVVDADGSCRIVVSAQDPGTPNWLDTAGFTTGVMSLRWEQCDTYPEQHSVSKVKIGDVRDHLPGDTSTVTAQERDAWIRSRRRGAQMRKRW
jgi:hypothetical protein